MCGTQDCGAPEASTVGRRRFLGGTAVASLTGATLAFSAQAANASVAVPAAPTPFPRVKMPEIRRRSDWAPDLLVKYPIEAEDVRFLLVHHTEQPGSDYQPEEVEGLLRRIYGYHTGTEKAWPDIAYNFFVDKFGRTWEGRTGSIDDGPLQGSATGGNQGFSQLCCFIGDFDKEPPPQVAIDSMITLLAWLAGQYGLDMKPGAKATFTSRGSNVWPAGSEVTTGTISTHRQMSQTECPGNACNELVLSQFQLLVSAQLAANAPATTALPAPVASTAPAATAKSPTTSTTKPAGAPKPSASSPSTTSKPPSGEQAETPTVLPSAAASGANWPLVLSAGAATAAAGGLAAGLWFRSRADGSAPILDTFPVTIHPNLAPKPTTSAPVDLPTASSTAEFVPLAGVLAGGHSSVGLTSARSPVTWWPPATTSGAAGSAADDDVLVFWLASSAYSAPAQARIESSMRASLDHLGATAGVNPGPWFTHILSTILPGLFHPPGSGLLLGLATSKQCLALTTGNARVEIPEVTGNHKPRPSLPGIDPRSGMTHRWRIQEGPTWLTGWLGGPGTLSVNPETIAANLAQGHEQDSELLGSTEGYLGVWLDRLTDEASNSR